MNIVIGSGPAGISCAIALLRKGQKVTMLDVGIELEAQKQELVMSMSKQQPSEWSPSAIASLKEGMAVDPSGVLFKRSYGSDYACQQLDDLLTIEQKQVAVRNSLAKGGLSNIWGAAILPYLAQDMADWPISSEELAQYYQSVFSFLPLAAVKDDLENYFPLYTDKYNSLKASGQTKEFLADLHKNKSALNARGIIYGTSRLAVFPENKDGISCQTCGLCLYGCPYQLIYNSTHTLDKLISDSNFSYKKNVLVTSFVERGDQVEIKALSTIDKSPLVFEAAKLYIGAGVLATTKIVMDSLEAYNHPLILLDSQLFSLPLLRFKATKEAMQEKLHTLSQIFLEIFDQTISEKTIHIQVYSYNDLYEKAIESTLQNFYPLLKLPVRSFLERFLLMQCYLPSELSHQIKVELKAPISDKPSKLVLQNQPNDKTKAAAKKVLEKLSKAKHLLRATPLSPLLRTQAPGKGAHSGGTLPMKLHPTEFETDTLGRPYGLKHVHLIDATTFPSIPSTTITLAVMANAYRIGQQ